MDSDDTVRCWGVQSCTIWREVEAFKGLSGGSPVHDAVTLRSAELSTVLVNVQHPWKHQAGPERPCDTQRSFAPDRAADFGVRELWVPSPALPYRARTHSEPQFPSLPRGVGSQWRVLMAFRSQASTQLRVLLKDT